MASTKIVLYTSKKRKSDEKKKDIDKSHPLALRIIKDRKAKYVSLGIWIKRSEWDDVECRVRKNHANSARMNNLILQKLAQANDVLLDNESRNKYYSPETIAQEVKGVNAPNSGEPTFFAFAEEFFNDMARQKRYTSVGPERSRIKTFENFMGTRNIHFRDITVSVLNKFIVHLGGEGKKKRYIMNFLVIIRTLFNRAIKEGVIDRSFYPFGKDKIKITLTSGMKVGLEKEELQEIIKLKYPEGTNKWHTRNVFLTSFYLAGARISDVLRLKWSEIQRGRIHYQMGKNDKPVSMKVPEQAKEIMAMYKHLKKSEGDYVFHDLKGTDPNDKLATIIRIRTATKRFNDDLKEIAKDAGITKNVSNHIARHTFGNIAGSRIPIPTLQKLYRHSSMLTTAVYQGNFMFKETDEALESVVNL